MADLASHAVALVTPSPQWAKTSPVRRRPLAQHPPSTVTSPRRLVLPPLLRRFSQPSPPSQMADLASHAVAVVALSPQWPKTSPVYTDPFSQDAPSTDASPFRKVLPPPLRNRSQPSPPSQMAEPDSHSVALPSQWPKTSPVYTDPFSQDAPSTDAPFALSCPATVRSPVCVGPDTDRLVPETNPAVTSPAASWPATSTSPL